MNRSFIIGLVGIVAIIVAILAGIWLDPEDESLERQTEAPATAPELRREAMKQATRPKAPPKSDPTKTAARDIAKAAPKEPPTATGAPAPKPAHLAPSFDIVRVNSDGDAVIAGRGTPGATITIYDDDKAVGTAKVDRNGEWVLVPQKPLRPGNRALGLVSKLPNGAVAKSTDVVVLAVPEKPKLAGKQPVTAPAKQPLAILVPRVGMEIKKVLQKPSKGADPGAMSLDVVDYDEKGNVKLMGRSKAGRKVFVYLDNELIGGAKAGAGGDWALRPRTTISPGLYKLRIDEVLNKKVVRRLELPFSRAKPLTEYAGEGLIIVQPGNSLWRIARRVLGEGTMYSVIYDANREQIRDPDLIYPGQIFAVPRTN